MTENNPNQEHIVIFHSDQELREYGFKLVTDLLNLEKTYAIELGQMLERAKKETTSRDDFVTFFESNLSPQFKQNEKQLRLLREQCNYLGFPTIYNNYHSHRNNIEVQ